MRTFTAQHLFSCTREQIFDLVADIERYPEFVPGWLEAHIERREGAKLWVVQAVGVGPFRWRFHSSAALMRPERAYIVTEDGPFEELVIDWRFEREADARCLAHFQVQVAWRSRVLEHLAGTLLAEFPDRVLTAFARRARELYGTGKAP